MTHVEKELLKTIEKIGKVLEQLELLKKYRGFLQSNLDQIDILDEIEEAEKRGDDVAQEEPAKRRPSRKKG